MITKFSTILAKIASYVRFWKILLNFGFIIAASGVLSWSWDNKWMCMLKECVFQNVGICGRSIWGLQITMKWIPELQLMYHFQFLDLWIILNLDFLTSS